MTYSERQTEPEELIGWKTAIKYALMSIVMLALAIWAYYSYIERRATELRAQQAFAEELKTLLGKKALLKQAMTKVGDLEKGLTNGMDKDELLGIVHQLDKDLTGVNNLIDEAVRKIDRYHGSTQRQTNWLPEFIATAYAQDGFAVPGNIKLMFAAAALVVIVSLVAYCLWLIARPIPDDLKKPDRTAVIADKKWAKELLNKQIVFLGGLIAGIVLR